MKKDRRKFIQYSGAFAAGALLFPQMACKQAGESAMETGGAEMIASGDIQEFGIQLYTLRDVLPDNPKEIIRQVADFGFHTIESYEGNQGMFWGMTNKEFKAYSDDLGLKIVSSHCNINENFEEKAAQAAEIGMEYLICPHIGAQKDVEAWKAVADKFNNCGDICAKNGIRFAYHNHGYSFLPIADIIPQDFLMENTNPETVDYELDIYWVVTAGADPVEYLKKYPNRFLLSHVKDRLKDAPSAEREASCDLGTGSINYKEILKIASDNGMKHFILEQERYDGTTPLKAAQTGAKYLKSLKFA